MLGKQKKRRLSDTCPDCGASPGEACWDDPHPTFVLKDRVASLKARCCGDGNARQKAAANELAEMIFAQDEQLANLEKRDKRIAKVIKEMRAAVQIYETAGGKGVLTINIDDWANRLEEK